jgi:hypothetical protein
MAESIKQTFSLQHPTDGYLPRPLAWAGMNNTFGVFPKKLASKLGK